MSTEGFPWGALLWLIVLCLALWLEWQLEERHINGVIDQRNDKSIREAHE